MKKMDLGEFTKFCKDFNINLHKVKITEIFRKVNTGKTQDQNKINQYLEHKHFKDALILLSEQLTSNLLIEHKERLRETADLIEQLDLPEQYEVNKSLKGKIVEILNEKLTKYKNYI